MYIYIYIYPLIYTPLPKSSWLYCTALRYVGKVHVGACTWQKGLKSIRTSSGRAKNTCLCTPSGRGSLLEKRVLDPFFTHF